MIRTFLAVELGDELRHRISLAQQDLRQRLDCESSKDIRITWVQPSSIHLSIRFLGDTDDRLLDPMREAMATVRRSHSTIQIPLERLQAFPNLRQPRVLWVGPSEQWFTSDAAKRLAALHREIESCCRALGFVTDDKPFTPHLTLARVKAGDRQAGQRLSQSGICDRPLSVGAIAVGAIVLMKSKLRPTGPQYTKLWEVGAGS
ncbi:MAG: RNA 2',3'-cyclic phosphodiesterase [Nitrospira sp.]|nr:RNA 2',3'-cyclic phosphodiesterase [Nitrospira sp.]